MRTSKTIILASFCLVFYLTSCSSGSISQKSPEELRMELKLQEESNPTNYLSADGTYRENFWGDKYKVSCKITNTATIASFKDIVVEVIYYTKTKTVLGTNNYTIYEIFNPSSTKTIQLTIDNYKNVNSIGLDVVSALAIE